MARRKFKWKFTFLLHLFLLNVLIKSLPIHVTMPAITRDTAFNKLDLPNILDDTNKEVLDNVQQKTELTSIGADEDVDIAKINNIYNSTRSVRQIIRPGQEVQNYELYINVNGATTFDGTAILTIRLSTATFEDPIELYAEDLNIDSVQVSIVTSQFPVNADFSVDDGILEIVPPNPASLLSVTINYSGQIGETGFGLYRGSHGDNSYIAMNLHPTNARRVFPCVDELTEVATVRFTFNGIDYNNVFANTELEENSAHEFTAILGPVHLWGMIAHDFVNINFFPAFNVYLYGQQYLGNLDSQASVAINFFINELNEWTTKPFAEILNNQDGRLNIMAVPDISRDWYALSTIPIWEPYIFMETTHSIKQRKEAITEIARAMARQWFGYVIYPENWRYQWIISGLGSYAAYELLKDFQADTTGVDVTLIDFNTIFVSDVIQESLLRDGYSLAMPLDAGEDIIDDEIVRLNIQGLVKYKAPAIMRMLRLVLGDEGNDFIQLASQSLLHSRSLDTVNTQFFLDSLNSHWLSYDPKLIGNIADFIEPWIYENGYPLIHVGLRQGGVLITQERFGFSSRPQVDYMIPLTYTRSNDNNFDNIYPVLMMETTTTLNFALGEEDWVVFNVQGQGYYRVNYDNELWERIIEALNDPERRQEIHPLNRATLVDDALNLARAGALLYDTAFEVVLTMEHETEYAVWKAFIRNMEFLQKRLVALVENDDDLDPDIYLRIVRIVISAFEDQIGFTPDVLQIENAMTSLTRGLVMDHACRAGYLPCIAAAIDWFYDPNSNEPIVNPDIPAEIRPAVYCTMMREGDDQAMTALYDRLETEITQYERVVILESLACSRDNNFVRTLLEETIAQNSPYAVEERSRIFKAVASSSTENAGIAISFAALRTNEIRNRYGGPEKLEEIIDVLAENMYDNDLSRDFTVWTGSMNSNLGDSEYAAQIATEKVSENLAWMAAHMDYVYEWMDENDAPTVVSSFLLLSVSLIIAIFNH